MKYQDAKSIFNRARNKALGASLTGRSTRLNQRGKSYAITYHNTDVVLIHPDGTYTLNTGGFRARTTKERINYYGPANVWQNQNVWYIGPSYEHDKASLFVDGMRVNAKGKPHKPVSPKTLLAMEAKTKAFSKAVSNYITNFENAIALGRLPKPSGGDCWGCGMHTTDGKEAFGIDHLLSHLEENYLVPSLLVNALRAWGASDTAIYMVFNTDRTPFWGIRPALRKYFQSRREELFKAGFNPKVHVPKITKAEAHTRAADTKLELLQGGLK